MVECSVFYLEPQCLPEPQHQKALASVHALAPQLQELQDEAPGFGKQDAPVRRSRFKGTIIGLIISLI